MFKTIINALKTPDVRRKLLFTLLLILVFRFGCYVTVPGVDTVKLAEAMGGASRKFNWTYRHYFWRGIF